MAFDAAPAMALGNETKVERLLRDARVTDSRDDCLLELRRAHQLIDQAHAGAGEPLDILPPWPE